ncbi:unnamed protein product [Heligmosomoides polygyrus]|uniref:MFS_1_like domain-containing protein n=1 Tax=Heligmosomoides polygyrus TaxID=6339 RepID=A0A3P8C918_HELPZ|nr:unnamed protein product [Heligmosomoides polygyrus]
MGIYVSFILGIYPTALSFTSSLANDQYLIAFYATSVGVAEISGGLLLEPLIKRVGERKLQVMMLVHVAFSIVDMTFFVLTIPSMSTMTPNTGASYLFHPSRLMTCLHGYLIGMGDFTLTASRVTICQLVLPENLIEVYSVTRAFQCISSCAVFYLSCRMTVECWTGTILGGMALGVTALLYVDHSTRRKESAASTTPSEKEASPFPESAYIDYKVY